jgi:hypothetical protein
MATEGTKFQINYKLADGTLINLYAANVQELETGLTDLSMVSTLIASTSYELAKKSPFDSAPGGPAAPTVASVAQSFNATPIAAPAPVVTEGQAPTCKHGNMTFRTGTSARGPWKAWMCSAPKGAVDKCDPIFLR